VTSHPSDDDDERVTEAPIVPMPPVATTALPWDADVPDPVAALRLARDSCGDTFAVVSGATTYLFLFSPEGVRSFYALPEEHASKGVADWLLLSRKLPEELFDGRRTMPHALFDRDHVQAYLHELDWAVEAQFAELGDSGIVDVFTLTRRLGHRLGLACWAGAAFTDRAEFDRLVVALDELDGAAAFVHPGAMKAVAARGKDGERAALLEVEGILARVLRRRDADPPAAPELFDEIIDRWSDEPGSTREIGIARDVALVHIASMSNLFAALGWMLVDLLERPHLLDRIRAGDRDLAERCALESTRLAQRSIMMRSVLTPVEVADEDTVYHVAPGAVVATFLPLTNTSAARGLDGYDPDRWHRRRLRDEAALPSRELVTAFGHGKHSCPAQSFSLAAMTRSVTGLAARYDLAPEFSDPQPVAGQIGGVARSETPCPMRYRRRD
jgi:cytochrome P450